jgi:hypothetical protein
MAVTAAVIGAVAAVGSAGYGAYSQHEAAQEQQDQNKKMLNLQRQTAQITPAKLPSGAISGAKADAAARTGGGFSPDFLSNMLTQETGQPLGLDVLADIRSQMGQQGP